MDYIGTENLIKFKDRPFLKESLVVLLFLSGLPSLCYFISILLFYIQASIILDTLPHWNNPDPKELLIYGDYNGIISGCFGVWVISFLVWLLLCVAYIFATRKNVYWKPVLFTLIMHCLSIVITLSPIFEWYVD